MKNIIQISFFVIMVIILQACAVVANRIAVSEAPLNDTEPFKVWVNRINNDSSYDNEERAEELYEALSSASSRSIEATLYMLEQGVPINHPSNLEHSRARGQALNGAAIRNKPKIVRLLLERGANPNIKLWSLGPEYNILGNSLMHPEVSRALLEGGANPNLWRNPFYPSLMAFNTKSPKVQALLAEYGGVLDPTDQQRAGFSGNEDTPVIINESVAEISKGKQITPRISGVSIPVKAKSFIGLGSLKSKFLGSEYDRSYKSNTNNIQQISFGYNDKQYLEIFGDININEDNKVGDFALGFALKDKVIRIERGNISGTIISDNDGQVLGEFDNDFQRVDVLNDNRNMGGSMVGLSIQSYAVPHLFEYNDGSDLGKHIQDDSLSMKSIGYGIYYDPIYNYLMSGQTGVKNDWYFSTSAFPSLVYAQSSDAPELSEMGVNDKSWLLVGFTASYELGWIWGYKTPHVGMVGQIGYHMKVNIFYGTEFLETEADENDIILPSEGTILHGLTAALNVSF